MLFLASAGSEIVHLLGHEHEHSDFHCELDDGQQHYHGDEIESSDCLLTQLQISSFDLLEIFLSDPKPPVDPQAQLPTYLPAQFETAKYTWPEHRGPPVI
ncbi:MAG: hypothetical protein AAFY36_00325 [Bacteroidota bacterium]